MHLIQVFNLWTGNRKSLIKYDSDDFGLIAYRYLMISTYSLDSDLIM